MGLLARQWPRAFLLAGLVRFRLESLKPLTDRSPAARDVHCPARHTQDCAKVFLLQSCRRKCSELLGERHVVDGVICEAGNCQQLRCS
jgi:hypothetical protein